MIGSILALVGLAVFLWTIRDHQAEGLRRALAASVYDPPWVPPARTDHVPLLELFFSRPGYRNFAVDGKHYRALWAQGVWTIAERDDEGVLVDRAHFPGDPHDSVRKMLPRIPDR